MDLRMSIFLKQGRDQGSGQLDLQGANVTVARGASIQKQNRSSVWRGLTPSHLLSWHWAKMV